MDMNTNAYGDAAQRAGERAGDKLTWVRDTMLGKWKPAYDKVEQFANQRPMVAVGLALLVGTFFGGSLLRRIFGISRR